MLPESDGTLEWDSTTLVVVHAEAGGERGFGYTYAHAAAAAVIDDPLRDLVEGQDAFALPAIWEALGRRARNIGRPGIAATAISAIDTALWDLKARLLELPLCTLLGAARDAVPIYGSGGFTSYSIARLEEQLGGWAAEGIPRVKMKVGREPADDLERVEAARRAIDSAELFVDANGAYAPKQALSFAELFAEHGVSWFEEPVSSADLEGLRLVRERAPAGMEIAAGEYAYVPADFRNLIGAVDCLQADATRCLGITGFLRAAAFADVHGLDLSAHTAPSLHLHACLAIPRLRHLEWFHDHVRIERMLFDGFVEPVAGELRPELSRPGHGLELRVRRLRVLRSERRASGRPRLPDGGCQRSCGVRGTASLGTRRGCV
ncbi:MAG: enolase C-terminal domain-like protein [Actinomycetota bacterium]